VRIQIRDTGPGIEPDKLPFIFDQFFQADGSLSRRAGGVGLGLTISRRFVEAHHGRIWVESQPKKGSTFSFTLPLADSASLAVEPEAIDVTYNNLKPNVLLVNNDPEALHIIRRQIEEYEWIQIPRLDDLAPTLEQYHPRAVVLNLPAEQLDLGRLPDIHAPVFACTLPRRMYRDGELAHLNLLQKPVDQEALARELARGGRVHDLLVIDDDRGFIQLLERQIEAGGYTLQVRHAYTGQEGLNAMRAQRPDLVFLDLVMPGFTGMEVLGQIDADPALKGIPICLVTSGSQELESVTHMGKDMILHNARGFRPSKVLDYLRIFLDKSEPGGGVTDLPGR
jgi:CheY-like chemotaxis protein